jgi:hypothetical protein
MMSNLALAGKVNNDLHDGGNADFSSMAPQEPVVDVVFNTVKFNDGSEFKVLVLDSPDKWEEAVNVKFSRDIQIDSKKIKLNLRCVPYGAYKYISENFEVPEEYSEEEDDSQQKSDSSDLIILKRKVLFFEAATGSPIAGKDLDEKAVNLAKRPIAIVDKIFDIINHWACAVIDDDSTEEFNAVRNKESTVVECNNIDDVFDSGSNVSDRVFTFTRPFQDFIIQVPLKSISSERRSQIENECKIPPPPRRPGKNFDVLLLASDDMIPQVGGYDDIIRKFQNLYDQQNVYTANIDEIYETWVCEQQDIVNNTSSIDNNNLYVNASGYYGYYPTYSLSTDGSGTLLVGDLVAREIDLVDPDDEEYFYKYAPTAYKYTRIYEGPEEQNYYNCQYVDGVLRLHTNVRGLEKSVRFPQSIDSSNINVLTLFGFLNILSNIS